MFRNLSREEEVAVSNAHNLLSSYTPYYNYDNTENLAEKIILKAKEKNLTIVTMESCTSGLICSTLTDIKGSSEVVKGGYITYSNEQKINCNVPSQIIDKYGVYSKECSIEMAKTSVNNILKENDNIKNFIGIGVTGSLGNIDPNNRDSIIGTVYYSFLINGKLFSRKIQVPEKILSSQRIVQKQYVVNSILNELLTRL